MTMKSVFAALALVFSFGLFSLTRSAQQEPLIRTRVSVTSQPSGATVIVDGRDRGMTPVTLYDLEPGVHHLKYRLAGYEEKDSFFTMDEGPVLEKNETLEPVKALFLLRSNPQRCSIAIDGIAAGMTPRLFTDLDANRTYKIRLTKTGYLPQTLSVKFNGREPLVREETMVLDSGSISISSEPAGAEVFVNGIPRGRTPVVVNDVPKGRAVVKFRHEGFHEEVRELSMRAGDMLNLPIEMRLLPGTLHLVSVPEGARFYLDDIPRGEGPLAITDLKPGEYRVRAEKDGFGVLEKMVTVEAGQSLREEFRLSNVMGRLEVRTEPPGATVVFDGRILGITKGESLRSDVFPVENVREGEHVVIVRKEGYEETSRRVTVRNSKTSQANIRLKRIFQPDIEIETVHGIVRGVLVEESAEKVMVEVSLGITKAIMRTEIRGTKRLKVKGQ